MSSLPPIGEDELRRLLHQELDRDLPGPELAQRVLARARAGTPLDRRAPSAAGAWGRAGLAAAAGMAVVAVALLGRGVVQVTFHPNNIAPAASGLVLPSISPLASAIPVAPSAAPSQTQTPHAASTPSTVAANTPPAVHPSPPPVAQPSPQSGPCTESQLGLTTTTTNGSTFTQYSGTDAQIALTATNHSGAQCSDFLNTCMRDYLKIFDAQGNLVYDSRNDTTNSCSNTDVAVTLAPGQSYTLNFTWKPGSCDQPACPLETYPQNFEAQGFWENWPSTQAKITVN